MSHCEITVEIFNPQGIYPSRSVVSENIAYLISAGIPTVVSESPATTSHRWERGKRRELLFGALMLIRKDFPCFSFHPHPVATIHFKDMDITKAISQAVDVIACVRELPCLYDPYTGKGDVSDPVAYIKQLRALDTYIDLFHAPQIPFPDLLTKLRPKYTISDRHFRPQFVSGLYRTLVESSRLVHIAVHYFVNAARLIHEDFIEDAGLNLNLVLEAIVDDFSRVASITDKRRAIEKMRSTIKLPGGHMEFLEELYWARNEFLAHIDRDMFTESQNIGDPDRYCYEHFASVSWLIRRYIKQIAAERVDAANRP
jgi:hypothetical protein